MPDPSDLSVQELEQLYDRLDAEGKPSEDDLQALIDDLNKPELFQRGQAMTRPPKRSTFS
ncbi:MAG: hypothetical protein C5B54_09155 [Acidobacteria bacterium]|nr:MAG: hypothetical protein C5B54_09155 [Acidobacteriota bacterium]